MYVKNGECYFRDDAGDLWLAESFVNEDGVTYSTATKVDP